MNGRNSISPNKRKHFKSSTSLAPEESAKREIVDPVYNEKDPISASIKLRVAEGSVMSVLH